MTWLSSSDDVGVTGYRVRRDGAVVGTAAAAAFVDQGLSPNTVLCYTVSAYDAAGNESTPSAPSCATTLADTTAPGTPEGVLAQAVSATRIDVTWLASSDDVGVTGFRVRRDGGVVGTAAAPAFAAQGLSPDTVYCFTVSAYDAASNESTPSAPACATTLADTTPPGTPEGVLAQAVSPARIALAWNPASDDVGVTGYRIRRGGVPVATAGSSPWEDATRQPQTAYCYTASALDAAGNESAPSGTGVRDDAAPADTRHRTRRDGAHRRRGRDRGRRRHRPRLATGLPRSVQLVRGDGDAGRGPQPVGPLPVRRPRAGRPRGVAAADRRRAARHRRVRPLPRHRHHAVPRPGRLLLGVHPARSRDRPHLVLGSGVARRRRLGAPPTRRGACWAAPGWARG